MIYILISSIFNMSETLKKEFLQEVSPQGYLILVGMQLLSMIAIFSIFYVFRSIGLYRMAKRKGLEKPWLAIVPFSALYIAQKLQPESKYVKTYKNLYVVAIITKVVALLCVIIVDCLYLKQPLTKLIEGKVPLGSELMGNNLVANLLNAVYQIATLAYSVMAFMIYSNIYKAYSLKRANSFTIWTIISYFVVDDLLLSGIFIFALRNNERVDYDAYIEYRRQQQFAYRNSQFGGNPYGNQNNPYGRSPFGGGNGYGNPYGNGYNNSNKGAGDNGEGSTTPDPFEEFSSNKTSPSNSNDDGSDDLFN